MQGADRFERDLEVTMCAHVFRESPASHPAPLQAISILFFLPALPKTFTVQFLHLDKGLDSDRTLDDNIITQMSFN